GVSLTGGDSHSPEETALVVTLLLALFTILFGSRSLHVTEHHRGMMLAIAFESLVKLLAFIAVGIFVTFMLFGGVTDLFDRALNSPELTDYWQRETLHLNLVFQTFIAILAFLCLPRQFQVAVVENIRSGDLRVARGVFPAYLLLAGICGGPVSLAGQLDFGTGLPRVAVVENIRSGDLRVARWVFPAYLLLAGIFVIPISLAGQLNFGTGITPDSYVINLPLFEGRPILALAAFLGGASAATGMVIVAAIALSTMVSNDVVMPLLLRHRKQQ